MSVKTYSALFICLMNISVVIATIDPYNIPPASEVTITTSPSAIYEGFTKSLSLNCTFPHNDKSQIAGLMSMIVSKTDDLQDTNFKKIAAITLLSGQGVEVKDDLGGGQVEGHITLEGGSYISYQTSPGKHRQSQKDDRFAQDTVARCQITPGGSSYISYQWNYPTSQVKGRYQCTVHGMDRLGHPVLSMTVAVIEEKPVDLQMAIDRIKGLETTKDLLTSDLNQTKEQLITTEQNLIQTLDKLNDCAQSNVMLNKTLYKTRANLSTTQTYLNLTRTDLAESNVMLNNTIETLDKTRANLSTTQTNLTSTINTLNATTTLLLSVLKHNVTVYNNHYYVMSDLATINVTVFQQKCKDQNGYLVEIDNQNEFDMLKEFINRLHLGVYAIYLGMTDEGHEGQWSYLTSGAPVTFTEWKSGNPNGGTGENCAVLYTPDMTMRDWNCVSDSGYNARYICEVPCGGVLPCT